MILEEKIHILCATDNNYASQCGIMLTSVLYNNPDIDVYVLVSSPLSARNLRRFNELQRIFKTDIYFITVSEDLFSNMPAGYRKLSMTTYFRLCAAQILPQKINRCLYLDCDIIVNGSLQELWNTNLNNHSAAVVSDVWCQRMDIYERLGYNPKLKYFNAGMLLINLDYWRRHNLQDKFFDYIRQNKDIIEAHDQDVLNVILADSKVHVSLKWNFEIVGYAKQYYESFPLDVQNQITGLQPTIIHYCGTIIRPWMLDYYNYPFAQLWMQYKRKSPWRWQVYHFCNKRHLTRKIVKRFVLWPLGYKKSTECEFITL